MGSVIIKNNGGGENENKPIPSPSDWLREFVTIGQNEKQVSEEIII